MVYPCMPQEETSIIKRSSHSGLQPLFSHCSVDTSWCYCVQICKAVENDGIVWNCLFHNATWCKGRIEIFNQITSRWFCDNLRMLKLGFAWTNSFSTRTIHVPLNLLLPWLGPLQGNSGGLIGVQGLPINTLLRNALAAGKALHSGWTNSPSCQTV